MQKPPLPPRRSYAAWGNESRKNRMYQVCRVLDALSARYSCPRHRHRPCRIEITASPNKAERTTASARGGASGTRVCSATVTPGIGEGGEIHRRVGQCRHPA